MQDPVRFFTFIAHQSVKRREKEIFSHIVAQTNYELRESTAARNAIKCSIDEKMAIIFI